MSYLTFHLVFIIPPILLLAFTQPKPLAGVGGLRARLAIPLLCGIAFTYTTPWDNYLVAHGIWWYGEDRVLATIGYVPIEEYLFFILQPVLTGLFLYQYLARYTPPDIHTADNNEAANVPSGPGRIMLGVSAFLSLAGFGILYFDWEPGLYMGLILAWASPMLVIMWGYDGKHLWRLRKALAIGIGIPTVYLWLADWSAITLGIWTISDQYTLGIDPFGLPIEEATFFLFTNMLVVKGILLFLQTEKSHAKNTMREAKPLNV